MSDMIQLNTRIDREVKVAGDSALSLIGLSPSQAVRALWEKAARRGKDLEEVGKLLSPTTEHETQECALDKAQNAVRQGWEFMDGAYASLGIEPGTVRDLPCDDDLLESALYERMAKRGLA